MLLTGCVISVAGVSDGVSVGMVEGQWVVITDEAAEDEFSTEDMDALLGTELAADHALRAVGAGRIDGNEAGDNRYQLYFVGADRDRVWRVLEPILNQSAVRWSLVAFLESIAQSPGRTILLRRRCGSAGNSPRLRGSAEGREVNQLLDASVEQP